MEPCHAPWTPEQVDNLNRWQTCGWVHPYTCGPCRQRFLDDHEQHELIATTEGWICPTCDYTQDWAMASTAELGPPPNPFGAQS